MVRLQLARQSAERVSEPSERIGVARELLPILIDANADTEDLGAVLGLAGPARELLVREMTQRFLREPAPSPEADSARFAKLRQVVQRAAPARPQAPAPPSAPSKPDEKDKTKPPAASAGAEMDYSEQAAGIAVIGLELLRLGQTERAREFADAAATMTKNSKAAPVPALALAMLLKLPVSETEKDSDVLQSAQVAATARSRNLSQAQTLLDQGLKGSASLRLDTILDLCEVLVEQDQRADALKWLAQASPLLEALRVEDTYWQRQRLLELMALAGSAEATQLVGKLLPSNSPAAQRARLEILRIKLAQTAGAIDPDECKPIAGASGAGAAASYLMARHNSRLDPAGALQWAETLQPDQWRPFAALGTAQSIAEQRK
jgi:hypothetical protein